MKTLKQILEEGKIARFFDKFGGKDSKQAKRIKDKAFNSLNKSSRALDRLSKDYWGTDEEPNDGAPDKAKLAKFDAALDSYRRRIRASDDPASSGKGLLKGVRRPKNWRLGGV